MAGKLARAAKRPKARAERTERAFVGEARSRAVCVTSVKYCHTYRTLLPPICLPRPCACVRMESLWTAFYLFLHKHMDVASTWTEAWTEVTYDTRDSNRSNANGAAARLTHERRAQTAMSALTTQFQNERPQRAYANRHCAETPCLPLRYWLTLRGNAFPVSRAARGDARMNSSSLHASKVSVLGPTVSRYE